MPILNKFKYKFKYKKPINVKKAKIKRNEIFNQI